MNYKLILKLCKKLLNFTPDKNIETIFAQILKMYTDYELIPS